MHRILSLILCLSICAFTDDLRAQTPTPKTAVEQLAARLLAADSDAAGENLLAENKSFLNAELSAVLIRQGRQLIGANDFANAERAFRLALKISETAGDQLGAASALRNLGGVSGMRGNFTNALDYFQKAVAAFENTIDENGLAQSLRGLGNVESSLGNYERGIAAFQKSLAIYEKLADKNGQAIINSSLNIVYQNVGDYERAFNYGNRALALARETGDKTTLGMSLSNLSSLSNSRGDYRSALQFNQEALRLFEANDDQLRIALTLNNIGDTYLRQNDFASAEDNFRRGLSLREKIGDKDGIARSNQRLGELMIRREEYPAALKYLLAAVALREAEAKEPASLAATLAAIGDVYRRQKDLARAGDFYQRALTLADSTGEKETLANVLIGSARFHLAVNELGKAQAEISRAVEIASALGLRETLWEAQTAAGEIQLADGNKVRARQYFEAAIGTVEESRYTIAGGERERQRFFETKLKPYHGVIEILVGEKRFETAFAYAERAKARVLLDVLQTGRAPLAKTMTATEQAQESKLRSRIFAADTKLQAKVAGKNPDAAEIAELRTDLDQARTALDSFTTLLYVAHPELKLQRGENKIVDLTALKRLLPDARTALLEYVVTENRTFVFVITNGAAQPLIEVYPIEIGRANLGKIVSAFRDKLARRDLRFADDAKKLYNLLVPPAARAAVTAKNNLIVAPDASLWEVPFQALIDSQNKYIVESAAVSYAPSLSVLTEIERRQNIRRDDSTLLAFGNPSSKSIVKSADASRVALPGEIYADLPEAEKQVKALSALYGANRSLIFTGSNATEAAFKKSADNFEVLHLATHGFLNDSSPLYSYILLAEGDADDSEDGKLEAREIMRMNLTANLVVLSACETGRGRIGAGEGLIGLSWSFFVAGSPTTMASLWKVESASTTELMLDFYRQMRNKAKLTSKSAALRASSIKLLKTEKYAHPFYWAGFVIIGNNANQE